MTVATPDTSVREWATFAYRTWTGVPAPYPRLEIRADDLRRAVLAPLMYQALSRLGDERASTFVAEYRQALTANRFRLTHAVLVRDALERAGLQVILIKGGAFLQRFAGADLGVRPMSDLDLLVGPGEFDEAVRVMLGLGYMPTDLRPISQRAAPARSFVREQPAARLDFDVHRALAQWPLALPLLHAVRSGTERVNGWTLPALPLAFCVTALHRARHGFQLSWRDLLDLKRTSEALDDDKWGEMIEAAARSRVTGAAYASFRQAVWWFGAAERDQDRLAQIALRISASRRRWLERMAPLEGRLAAGPVWNRPLVRNLVVTPCATGTFARSVAATIGFLPLRAADEWVKVSRLGRSPLARLRHLSRFIVRGAEEAIVSGPAFEPPREGERPRHQQPE